MNDGNTTLSTLKIWPRIFDLNSQLGVNITKHYEPKKNTSISPGVDFINICSRAQDEKLFLANSVWRTAHKFGELCTDLANFVRILAWYSQLNFSGNGW